MPETKGSPKPQGTPARSFLSTPEQNVARAAFLEKEGHPDLKGLAELYRRKAEYQLRQARTRSEPD
jgi:hypothetical protein